MKYYWVNEYHFENGDTMDELDSKLLELLQSEGRMTISELSKKMSLSRPSVSERLYRLQEEGIIDGFTARVFPEAVGRSVVVFVQISDLKAGCREFEQVVEDIPDILECHGVTGTASYFMKAAVANMESLGLFVDKLTPYGRVNTSIVLSSPIRYRCVLPNDDKSDT